MRVLITGVEGFVGGYLERRLEELGHEVWGTTLGGPPPGHERWLRCDVREEEAVRRAVAESGAEGLVHLAARSSVAESHADPAGTYRNNVAGSLNVLEAARREGMKGPIVMIGSGEVYGNRGPAALLRETDPPRPLSAYAGAKAAQEVLGLQYARAYGLRVVLTRSFAHTGPRQDPRFVLPSFARQLAILRRNSGGGLLRVGNLAPVRDYLDVRDVVEAYALLLERGEAGGVVNVCSGRGFSLRDYLEELIEIASAEVVLREDPELLREIEIQRLVGDPAAMEGLGWRPRISTRDMLADLLTYWSERS